MDMGVGMVAASFTVICEFQVLLSSEYDHRLLKVTTGLTHATFM
jgi:hypothetical protein